MRRLVLIKYFRRVAGEQADAPEPMCAIALLGFHDSAELFLQLAAERLNVGKSGLTFMEYFDELDRALRPSSMAQRESMRRLNDARRAFKHHGTLPAKAEILRFRASLDEFFAQNTRPVFGVPFAEVSLASLANEESIRQALQLAESSIESGDAKEALSRLAEAFERLLGKYAHQGGWGLRSAARLLDDTLRVADVYSPASDLADSIESLAKEVTLLRHGIDTRRLTVFQQLTPKVSIPAANSLTGETNPRVTWTRDPAGIPSEAVSFCYDFVIDAVLRMQETDALIEHLGAKSSVRHSDFGPL